MACEVTACSPQFVKPGIVLVREGAQFPGPVELKRSICYPRWDVVESTATEMDRQVTKAGWHLFWIVGVI